MAAENLHISPQFVLDVISGQTRTDASKLAFGDPDTFVAGNIHACFPAWERIAKIAPFKLTPNILRWIPDCVDVREFFQSFKDVRAQKFPHTDFFKTLTAGRK